MMKKYLMWLISVGLIFIYVSLSFAVNADDYPTTVFDNDDRVLVSNTRVAPYSSIAFTISVPEPGWKSYGTGFLVEDDILVTSAHIIKNNEKNSINQDFKIYLGSYVNGYRQSPFGEVYPVVYKFNKNYLSAGDVGDDFAVIKLSKPIGRDVGKLSLSTNLNTGSSIWTAGYPGDKFVNGQRGSMWRTGGMVGNIYSKYFETKMDTMGGQSGSPVFNSLNQVVGIVSAEDRNGVKPNYITRVQPDLIKMISEVKSMTNYVYRLYNHNSGQHFFTSSLSEKNNLVSAGWKDEGIAWYSGSNQVVYRLYNKNSGEHFYTTDLSEKNSLKSAGWKDEGIAFYSGEYMNVYRLYNKNNGYHMYTISATEKENLISNGWILELVAFKAA